MEGSLPSGLEHVPPKERAFPASWKDAAIRILLDSSPEGILCAGCAILASSRAELRLLHADHRLAYARGGLTTWENLQLLCARCNFAKSDG